jgi:uncharacterized MAPEG superfamily protein
MYDTSLNQIINAWIFLINKIIYIYIYIYKTYKPNHLTHKFM